MTSKKQTTRRAQSSKIMSADDVRFAIHWVFPVEKASILALLKPRVLFGRADECDFILEGSEASRHHAEVRQEGLLRILIDLDSTNGVFIDGERVEKARLTVRAVIRLGEWIGVIVKAPEKTEEHIVGVREVGLQMFGGKGLATAVEPAKRAAKTDLPIVVQGETGTGKECVARAIHGWSQRPGPFIAVNCAALPETLAEAELFGYRKGAFTGADRASPGYFRVAEGGTLLLDEITDLPLALQAKLLRVLEQKEVLPLGEAKPTALNVRIITATQEPLDSAVKDKRFRADLYARLEGLTVKLPPLRDRIEDIPGLFAHFLLKHSGVRTTEVEPKLMEQLLLYDWPFNVRELELLARRLLVLYGHEPLLRRAHLPDRIRNATSVDKERGEPSSQPADSISLPIEQSLGQNRNERDLAALVVAIRNSKGNVARAAAAVGISRQRAYRLMEGRPDVDLDALRQADKLPHRERRQ
jgi:DNA-binding NtrC family response regulator